MEGVKDVTPAQPVSTTFQSIADFIREQDQLDALQAKTTPQRPWKKIKLSTKPDPGVLDAEKAAISEMGETNWVGKLGEYRAANPASSGLIYTEGVTPVGPTQRFTCIALVVESAAQFGSNAPSFSKKKDAKRYAAKKAVDFLVSENFMPSDGSVKFPKPLNPSSPPVGYRPTSGFASQVPILCIRLGFRVPSYKITAVTLEPPMYTVYADFGGDPRVTGKVGLVQNVFGKKNAKESCAEIVVALLRDIERQRLLGESEGVKRKRSFDSGDEIDIDMFIKMLGEEVQK